MLLFLGRNVKLGALRPTCATPHPVGGGIATWRARCNLWAVFNSLMHPGSRSSRQCHCGLFTDGEFWASPPGHGALQRAQIKLSATKPLSSQADPKAPATPSFSRRPATPPSRAPALMLQAFCKLPQPGDQQQPPQPCEQHADAGGRLGLGQVGERLGSLAARLAEGGDPIARAGAAGCSRSRRKGCAGICNQFELKAPAKRAGGPVKSPWVRLAARDAGCAAQRRPTLHASGERAAPPSASASPASSLHHGPSPPRANPNPPPH
jgi:hypothetical protein